MKKRILCLLLSLILLISGLNLSVFATGGLSVSIQGNTDPIYDLSFDSEAILLYNRETGSVVLEKDAETRRSPASITKVMTALVVLEECEDPKNTVITCPAHSMFDYIIQDRGVHMELRMGEQITVYDLLMGLMLNSYCDVAELLAWYFGGESVEGFVEMMNAKAAELGLENTHFENAHGLYGSEHYSTPRDIAVFFEEALKNPIFQEIIRTREYTIPATSRHAARPLEYTVGMYYEGHELHHEAFVGGKSGFTDQAGRCLVTYSELDGVSYVSVLLGSNKDHTRYYPSSNMSYYETSQLINYVYEHYELRTVVEAGTVLGETKVENSDTSVPVIAKEDVKVLARVGEEVNFEGDFPASVTADKVGPDKNAGTGYLTMNGDRLSQSFPLYFDHDGTPIVTKSALEQGAEEAAGAVLGIFRTDQVFVTLLILLLLVIAVSIPALKITQYLHKQKSKRPKH